MWLRLTSMSVDAGLRASSAARPLRCTSGRPLPPSGVRISTLRRSTPSAVPISLSTASLAANRAASEAAPPVAYDACSAGV